MKRIISVTIVHFVVTAVSFFGFAMARDSGWPLLEVTLKWIARVVTIPGRQVGYMLLVPTSLWIWLVFLINSIVWAVILVRIWMLIDRGREAGG